MGVDIFNVHAAGGYEMMHAAVTAANEEAEKNCTVRPKITAVTILTSLDKKTMNDELGIDGSVEESVLRLAKLSESAGLDGIVCSAADLYAIKNNLPTDFMFITPGVKGVTTSAGTDQKRVFSPANAIKGGSTILVVGRAIIDAPDKRKAAFEILQDMAKSL
jgi:orotidine-5'-phosphate decarboxylase